MAGNLGGLVVTLGLDAVQYFTGLNKAEQEAKRFADRLEKDVQKGAQLAQKSFLVMVGAATAAAVAIDQLIKEAANFKDLEERTGASAEALASFSVSAAVAGTTSEDVAGAMNKLAKNLTGVDDESKAAGAALKALGIPIEDFKTLDPAAQMLALAKAFGSFQDSAEKGAAAMALMGRGGATLLPFLKELAQGAGPVNILSQDQIDRADEYADAQKRVMAELKLYAQVAAVEVIPAFTQIGKAVLEAIQALVGVDDATDKLTRDQRLKEFGREIGEWAKDAALVIGTVAESLLFLARTARAVAGSFEVVFADLKAQKAQYAVDNLKLSSDKFPNPFDPDKRSAADRIKARDDAVAEAKDTATRANKMYSDLIDKSATPITDAMRESFAKGSGAAGTAGGKLFSDRAYASAQAAFKNKPRLDFSGAQKKDGGADKAVQEARRLLDVQLKEQERAVRIEQDKARDQQHFLQARYDDDLISYRDYFAEKQRILDEAQTKILAAQQAQIDAAKAFAARPDLNTADKAAADEKVQALQDKREETRRSAEIAAFDAQRALTKEALAYQSALADVNAQVLELAGNLEGAARIRIEQQQLGTRKLFEREGNTEGLAQLDALKAQELARVSLGKATQEYSLTMQRLGTDQARVDLAARSGAITTLDAINKRSELAKQYIGVLHQQAAAAETAARKMAPGPEQDAAIAHVQQLQLEIEALAESANELENTFRGAFVDTLAGGLTDVITGTKSVKDAFKDMEKQIVAFVSRMAAQNIAEAIFGKTGPASGASGLFASLFGGGGLGGLFGGGSGGAGFASAQTGLDIGSFLGFAGGGSPPVGKPSLVGERGPELFVPRAAGNIIPNSELAARRAQRAGDVNISITVPGNVSRATADQIALRTGAAVNRAINRNG
jgi:hypothetical protein